MQKIAINHNSLGISHFANLMAATEALKMTPEQEAKAQAISDARRQHIENNRASDLEKLKRDMTEAKKIMDARRLAKQAQIQARGWCRCLGCGQEQDWHERVSLGADGMACWSCHSTKYAEVF
jgi:hypothetical protein